MKKYITAICCLIVIFSFSSLSWANPLTKIMSFFERDLAVSVLFKNHKNLAAGSQVYLLEHPDAKEILAGKVESVSLTGDGMSKVDIVIERQYKNQIRETTFFVLMNSLFSTGSHTYILAVTPAENTDAPLLKSGAQVTGLTYMEYTIATTGGQFKKVMDSIRERTRDIVREIEEYTDNFDTKAFTEKLDELTKQLSQFSEEQKKAFKNEVLPSLKNTLDSIMEKLEKQGKKDESEALEKQLNDIENLTRV